LLLHCPAFREFFNADAFKPVLPGSTRQGATGAHPHSGMWIVASLFVARCLKVSTSSKFAVHPALAPQVRFSPGVIGMPRPPPYVLLCSGESDPSPYFVANAPPASTDQSSAAVPRAPPGAGPSGLSRTGSRRQARNDATRQAKGRRGTGALLTSKALTELGGATGAGNPRRSRAGSAASTRSGSSASSFDSEYDDDDEWLAEEDDDNFRIAVPDALRKLGPSELINHWIAMRRNGELWNGLARVVTALVLRHRVLDRVPSSKPRGQQQARK
jgi:hypothetical protein